MVNVIIDSKYYREQFDDWLAGGKVDYKRKTYYWSAREGCLGWEIEIMEDREWCDLSDKELKNIINSIEKCLRRHKTVYTC
jgi:hypothetical protein